MKGRVGRARMGFLIGILRHWVEFVFHHYWRLGRDLYWRSTRHFEESDILLHRLWRSSPRARDVDESGNVAYRNVSDRRRR